MKSQLPLILISLVLFSCKKDKSSNIKQTINSGWELNWIDIKEQQFLDEKGRTLQIRGINIRVDGLFDVAHIDGRIDNEIIPLTTEEDIKGIAAMGFNVVRLPINWSGYEPERNQINQTYINRIKEVVAWCKNAGIYVQLDWHFDAYSKEIGEDGAPYWAVYPFVLPKVQGPLDFNQLFLLRANPFGFLAYQNFFINYNGFKDEFLDAWAGIINEFKDEKTVIGFEPMNEPICYAAGQSDATFMQFYSDCSTRMRAIDTKHSLWLEPDAIRNFLETSPLQTTPFIDKQIVYCPHYYPNLTQGANFARVDAWKSVMKKPMDRIVQETNSWNAPCCINEWGINPSTTAGNSYVIAMREMAEDRNIHNAFWVWKEPKPGTSGRDGNWGFYDHISGNNNWTERVDAKKNMAVPYVMAMPGKMIKHRFNLSTSILSCSFITNNSIGNPIVYIPENWYPNGYEIFINGIKTNGIKDGYNRVGVDWDTTLKNTILLEVRPK